MEWKRILNWTIYDECMKKGYKVYCRSLFSHYMLLYTLHSFGIDVDKNDIVNLRGVINAIYAIWVLQSMHGFSTSTNTLLDGAGTFRLRTRQVSFLSKQGISR